MSGAASGLDEANSEVRKAFWYIATPPPTAASMTPCKIMLMGFSGKLAPFYATTVSLFMVNKWLTSFVSYFSITSLSSSFLVAIELTAFWMGGNSWVCISAMPLLRRTPGNLSWVWKYVFLIHKSYFKQIVANDCNWLKGERVGRGKYWITSNSFSLFFCFVLRKGFAYTNRLTLL